MQSSRNLNEKLNIFMLSQVANPEISKVIKAGVECQKAFEEYLNDLKELDRKWRDCNDR